MAEKVTRMVIKVNLECWRCYKKIKKVLCKFPQIRDQIYNEKQNMVLITVVCCSPEKIRQMIIRKGGETVQGVEILLDKPKEPEKKPEKPPGTPKVTEVRDVGQPDKPKDKTKTQRKEEKHKPPAPLKPLQEVPEPLPQKVPIPVAGYPPMPVSSMVPVSPMVGVCCCPPGYGGYGGRPCYCGRRRPVMCFDGCGRPADECQGGNKGSYHWQGRPVLCDDGCGRPTGECQGGNRGFYPWQGRPVMCDEGCGSLACECPGGNRGYYVSRCDYLSEENAAGCTVM